MEAQIDKNVSSKHLTERNLLQRRIRNQRREIRRLNRQVAFNSLRIKYWIQQADARRAEAYRHAASIAGSCLFGRRIAEYIRQWI
jgi:hypothetical protein